MSFQGRLNSFGSIDAAAILKSVSSAATPFYLYDEQFIIDRCALLTSLPHPYGLTIRYAMKANSTRALLRLISKQGLKFDASSMNEVRRTHAAGVAYPDIMLTSQETQSGADAEDLRDFISQGMKYNVCSLRQLSDIGDFAATHGVKLALRIHPGVGSGESATRNTGDAYSCFGIHLSDIKQALEYANEKDIVIDHAHVHIGSGSDPEVWIDNVDRELGIVEEYFPDVTTVNFGGGFREARMPSETPIDIVAACAYMSKAIEDFYRRTGRKLHAEIEPGTFVVGNSGYMVTTVLDKKKTGPDGHNFIVLDGGMEMNTRPLMYSSQHPFYVISRDGRLLSSEFDETLSENYLAVPVGCCCENGDSQSLDSDGVNTPRAMAEPDIGDFVVVGGTGAYCSTMSPINYNSHAQAAELLYTKEGDIREIRRRQTLEQIMANEL